MNLADSARDAADEAVSRLVVCGALGDARKALIPDSLVAAVAAMVDATGICRQLAEWRAEDRTTGPGGRPGSLGDRTVMTLLTLLALEHSPLLITRMVEITARRLSLESRAMLGINVGETTDQQWYGRTWRAIHGLLNVIDPFPAPRNRLHSRAEWEDIVAARDPKTSIRKQKRLDWVCNQLIEVTMKMIPRDVRRRWKGNVCIDATLVAAFGKRGTPKISTFVGIEPDAAWYVRKGDHRDSGDESGHRSGKRIWGWEAIFAVMSTGAPESHTTDHPYLVAGIGFGKPGHDVSGLAIRTFSSIVGRGHPVAHAVADRAYFPNAIPGDLQLPLRAMGYDLVFDYREDQLGIKEGYAGAIQVEGAWYCPSMPESLVAATIDYRVNKTIDEATWRERIVQRRKYSLRPKELADADGHIPMRCPAVGASATALCPLKPHPTRQSGVRVRISQPPGHPDRICTNRSSVSFPPAAGAKYAQPLHYGSPEWQAMYSTARNTIEGFNGYVKDANREALDQPGRRRIRGYAAQYLLVTLLVVSANIRKLRTFLAEARADADGTLTRITKQRSRRRDTLKDAITVSTMPLSGDPPAA